MLSTLAAAPAVIAHAPGWGAGFWFVPLIFWALLLATIVALALIRRRRGWPPVGPGMGPWGYPDASRSAESVLAERFARGEIDETEYRARLEVLRAQQPHR